MEAVKMGLLEQKAIEILILYHNSVFERWETVIGLSHMRLVTVFNDVYS